jgi:hypothetical protein
MTTAPVELFDRLGFNAIVVLKTDDVLDGLARAHEVGRAHPGGVAGAPVLGERALHEVKVDAYGEGRVDDAAVTHALEPVKVVERTPVAMHDKCCAAGEAAAGSVTMETSHSGAFHG